MAKDEYVPFTGKLDAAPQFEPFNGTLDGEEPSLVARAKQGASRAFDSARTALTDDPNKIAQIAYEQARNALPQTATQRQMAEEIAPYSDAASKAEGVVDNVKAWGALGFKRAGQLLSNPGEAAKMVAEQLPNSLPSLAGGIAGAKLGAMAGTAVTPGVGTVIGGLAGSVLGGFAGGYGLEKGAAMQDQVQKEAQAQRIDLQDESAVARMVALKQPEFDAAAQRKGVGTAGTDALLNVATMGLAGVGGRTLAKEVRTLAQGVKAGTINAADAARLGIEDEALVWVNSRKGRIITRAQVSDRPNKGAVYMTYQWWVGACNELTSAALDPKSHTPEFKYCACRVEKIDDQKQAERDVKAQYTAIRSRMGIEVKEV